MKRTIIPAIDHSLLSPSGRISKRARTAAMKLETARLFAGFGDLKGTNPQPSEKVRLLRTAANLRDLAGRGMHPRKYLAEAQRLEAQANLLN